MKKIKIVLLAISGLFLVSCESSTVQDVSVVVKNPTYDANIKEVMTSKCTSCHYGGNQNPDLENYAQVKDAILNGDLLCRIDDPSVCFGSIMPESGRMPQATIDMIKLWQTQNYPEN
jgi:hypothetical protein